MRSKKVQAIFQLKVGLRDIQPPIWHRIQESEDTKLPRLHGILQLLFNWEDYHLHDVVVGRRVYSVPDPDADAFYPRCIAGARNGPLEEAGGPGARGT